MRYLLLFAAVAMATIAHGRTIVETSIGQQVVVTVKRLDDASWSGRIKYQTFSADGKLVSEEEQDVGDLVSDTDKALVVDVLNRTWTSLHSVLAVPTPVP